MSKKDKTIGKIPLDTSEKLVLGLSNAILTILALVAILPCLNLFRKTVSTGAAADAGCVDMLFTYVYYFS